MTDLEQIAKGVRRRIIEIAYENEAIHIGSCLSCVDILVALYFSEMEDDDIFILSKGHAALALYVVLNEKGVLSDEILDTYLQDGGLPGMATRGYPGVVCSTGSLGHGLPMAVGMAYALKLAGSNRRVFVLMGDGECQEGSVWEAVNMAERLKLDNLRWAIDHNGLQGYMHTATPPFHSVHFTTKGKGVSFMENDMKWHYYKLTKELRDQALKELS